MKLVTIDNGNTNPTVGFFDSGILVNIIPLSNYTPDPSDYILISSVGKKINILPSFDLKSKRTKTHFFDMPVHYSESLGEDRLVAAYALYKKNLHHEKVLLIDAGTFITCDLVTLEGFQGGYIFPGIYHFLKTYSEGAQLPHLLPEKLFAQRSGLPHKTEDAILQATEIYLEASIDFVIKKTSPDKIVLTGGSADDLLKVVNLSVPFVKDRHLIHSALSLIHESQIAQE